MQVTNWCLHISDIVRETGSISIWLLVIDLGFPPLGIGHYFNYENQQTWLIYDVSHFMEMFNSALAPIVLWISIS